MAPPRYFFLALLGVACWLRVHYGHAFPNADAFAYLNAALDANERGWGRFITGISTIYENRLSVVLPLAAFQALFGRTELALELTGLFFSFGAIGVTFALGRELADEWAGWFSAFFIATIPQDIWYGTSSIPDSLTPLYVGMALYAALRAQRRPLDRSGVLWYLAAGFFVLCCFQARATGALMVLPLGLWGLLQPRQRLVRGALPGIAFGVLLASLWGGLWLATGDHAIQLRQLVQDGTGTRWTGTGKPFQHLFSMVPLVRLAVELPALAGRAAPFGYTDLARYAVNTYHGLHYYVVWPAALWALWSWRRVPAARLAVTAFLSLYLFFEFGSTSLTSYQPIWKYERFLTIISVPSALVAGVAAATLLTAAGTPRWLRRAWPPALVLYLAFCAAVLEANTRLWKSPYTVNEVAFAQLKRAGGPRDIYVVDERWELRGHALLRLEPTRPYRLALLPRVNLDSIHDATVILDWSFFDGTGEAALSRSDFDPRLFETGKRPTGWHKLRELKTYSVKREPSTVEVFQVR